MTFTFSCSTTYWYIYPTRISYLYLAGGARWLPPLFLLFCLSQQEQTED